MFKKMKYAFLICTLFSNQFIFADEESVLFEQVFADPSNIELNFNLARIQLKNGNYKGAAASLE